MMKWLYWGLWLLFGFIGNLRTISASEITNNCKVLIKKYSTDINDKLINETIHFSKYLIEYDRYNTITKKTVGLPTIGL